MRAAISRVAATWLALLALGAAEYGASYLPLARAWRPLIMFPGILMVIVVAVVLMEVRKGPAIIRAFAVGAVFWLLVLLILGTVDPLTRTLYLVGDTATEAGDSVVSNSGSSQ